MNPAVDLPNDLFTHLTDHLTALATQLGYAIDLEALDPVCGLHTRQALDWAGARTRHASPTYQRRLPAGPITFGHTTGHDFGDALTCDLLHQDRMLRRVRYATSYQHAHACHALRRTGLTWPITTRPDSSPAGTVPAGSTGNDQDPQVPPAQPAAGSPPAPPGPTRPPATPPHHIGGPSCSTVSS